MVNFMGGLVDVVVVVVVVVVAIVAAVEVSSTADWTDDYFHPPFRHEFHAALLPFTLPYPTCTRPPTQLGIK